MSQIMCVFSCRSQLCRQIARRRCLVALNSVLFGWVTLPSSRWEHQNASQRRLALSFFLSLLLSQPYSTHACGHQHMHTHTHTSCTEQPWKVGQSHRNRLVIWSVVSLLVDWKYPSWFVVFYESWSVKWSHHHPNNVHKQKQYFLFTVQHFQTYKLQHHGHKVLAVYDCLHQTRHITSCFGLWGNVIALKLLDVQNLIWDAVQAPNTLALPEHPCSVSPFAQIFSFFICEMVIEFLSGSDTFFFLFLSFVPFSFVCFISSVRLNDWSWVTVHTWPVCRFLGVPPGRGSCPLTGPLPFDLIYTDYHGLQQMKQHMGLSLRKHKSVFCSLPLSLSVCVISVSLPSSKYTVCLFHPFSLPVIAFLMKYFTIGLLTGRCYRPVTSLCISRILPLGWSNLASLHSDQSTRCRLLGWCHFLFSQHHKLLFICITK